MRFVFFWHENFQIKQASYEKDFILERHKEMLQN
jgi:hypothetical protein